MIDVYTREIVEVSKFYMATDCFRIKKHFKNSRKKFMEQNFKCSLGASESVLKVLPQQIESPPPKPPRRRYSDQISASSLGTFPTGKKYEENVLRHHSRSKISNSSANPKYLSLPATLPSNPLTEHNNSSKLLPQSNSFTEQSKYFQENGSQTEPKIYCESLQCRETNAKQIHSSMHTCGKKEFRSVSQGLFVDNDVSKYQFGNSTTCSVDKIVQNSLCNNMIPLSNCDSQHLKSPYIKHRCRHHSDSAIRYFNMPNRNSMLKSDQICRDNFSFLPNALKKCSSVTSCSCCKKNCFILQEIKTLKEINEKLWQHLCSVQNSLENERKKPYEGSTDVSISGLLSSVYHAQKAKDNAMEERLKIAVEERDAAVLELENVISAYTKSFDTTDALDCQGKELDEGLKELLQETGCSLNPSKVLKHQRKLLAHISHLKKLKQENVSYEAKCATAERDKALEKVANLEEEIKALKHCFELWNLDNKHWELTLFDVVHQLVHQRDNLLSKVSKVDNNDVSNVLCRTLVSKLDFIEKHTVPQFENPAKSSESHCSHQLVLNDSTQPKFFGNSDEIDKLQEEVFSLNTELADERTKREQAEENCLRLERLIQTLRRKLNGQNIGIPV